MNKGDLVSAVSATLETQKSAVAIVVDAVFVEIASALERGEEVVLPGIGKLKPSMRAARKGRNPKSGAVIDIPETRVVKFKAFKALKEAI